MERRMSTTRTLITLAVLTACATLLSVGLAAYRIHSQYPVQEYLGLHR